jgi:hypothetical protein
VYTCVTTQVDSSLTDLYTGSWSPSQVNFCHFKVSVLVPLEWGHQMLSCFGFSTYSYTDPSVLHICLLSFINLPLLPVRFLGGAHSGHKSSLCSQYDPGLRCLLLSGPSQYYQIITFTFVAYSWFLFIPKFLINCLYSSSFPGHFIVYF